MATRFQQKYDIRSGDKYGSHLVLEQIPSGRDRSKLFLCSCERCGRSSRRRVSQLVRSMPCGGCLRDAKTDLTGKSFGKLLVMHPVEGRRSGCMLWKCLCECGVGKVVKSGDLNNGSTKSCGCLVGDTRRAEAEQRLKNNTLPLGSVFGNWKVLGPAIINRGICNISGSYCSCVCGRSRVIDNYSLRSGNSLGCKNCWLDNLTYNLEGKQFGYWTVVERDYTRYESSKIYWRCKCSCGTVKSVTGHSLRQGATVSCGCVKGFLMSEGRFLNNSVDLLQTEVQERGKQWQELHEAKKLLKQLKKLSNPPNQRRRRGRQMVSKPLETSQSL